MNSLNVRIKEYLYHCRYQKKLEEKTLKAYLVDLNQFSEYIGKDEFCKNIMKLYLVALHKKYQKRTVKRKIASVKAFFNYMCTEDIMMENPLRKINMKFKEEKILPRVIPIDIIEKMLQYMYANYSELDYESLVKRKYVLRDILIIEMLFGTGMRISEVCNIKVTEIDILNRRLCINGKGGKERYLHLNDSIFKLLNKYVIVFEDVIEGSGYLFNTKYGKRYSEQSARKMIHKHVDKAQIDFYITPHMFRHSFATSLLEEDVDIRYIQKILGHSSIITTQIYTEVSLKKQSEILETKHPRRNMKLDNYF